MPTMRLLPIGLMTVAATAALPLEGTSQGLAAGDLDRALAAGTTSPSGAVRVVGLLPDGRLDRSFGGGAIAPGDLAWLLPSALLALVRRRSARRRRVAAILCAASAVTFASGADAQRLELDARYGTSGTALDGEPLVGESFGETVALPPAATVLADGSVLFAGRTSSGLAVRKFDPGGAPATGFGSGGTAPVAIDGGSPGLLAAVDGRLLVAGTRTGGVVRVARLLPDGALDRTFGSDGYADRALPGQPALSVRLRQDDAGRILVAAGGEDQLHLWRLRADGAVDAAFVGAVVRQTSYAGYALLPVGLETMADGSTFVLAERPADLPEAQQLLLRFDADGRYDRSIGTDLRRVTAIQRDRDVLYVLGQSGPASGAITWLTSDGQPYFGFCRRSWDLPFQVEDDGWVLPLAMSGSGYLLTIVGQIVVNGQSARGLATLDFEEDCSPFLGSQTVLDVAPALGLAFGRVESGVVLAGSTLGPSPAGSRPAAVRLRAAPIGVGMYPGRASFAYDTMVVAGGRSSVEVPIRRTGGAAGAASVDYQTFDLTTGAGQYYGATRGTVHWGAGEAATKYVRVSLAATPPAGALTRFGMTLSNATGSTLAERPTVQIVLEGGQPATPPGPPPAPTTPATPAPVSGGGGASAPADLTWLLPVVLVALARSVRRRQRPSAA
jgi:hypothetical protein